jgi:hypothetical protein
MIPRVSSRRSATQAIGHVAPFGLAAFAVHQLRYVLAFGGHAGIELQRSGHAYLHSLVPWIVLLLALALGGFARGLGRALAGHSSPGRYGISLAALWLVCAAALLAVFTVQEAIEGLVIAGHPAGLAGIFGYGGWWAIPVCACFGLMLAAWLHGARWVLAAVARRHACPARPRRRLAFVPIPPLALWQPVLAPLCAGWSDRGPPRAA